VNQPRKSEGGDKKATWEWSVASRMIRSKGRGAFSAVSWTSMLGIILGVTSLVVVLSITGGFERAFQERILGFHPHLVVLDSPSRSFEEYREAVVDLLEVPEVEDVSPSTYNEMLIAGRKGRAGISLKGLPLAGLEKLLNGGVEYAGELSLLDDTLQVETSGAQPSFKNVVVGTSWSVLVRPEGQSPLVVRDRGTRAEPGQARVRFVHTNGSEGMWLDASGERVWVPGSDVSRGVDLAPGTLTIKPLGDSSRKSHDVRLEEGETALFVLNGNGGVIRIPEDKFNFSGGMTHAAVRMIAIGNAGEPESISDYTLVEGRLPGVLLGYDLWKKLSLKEGEAVSLASPLRGIDDRMMGPLGMAPSSLTFQAVGWFKSGYFEYDSRMGVTEYRTVQRLLNRGDSILWLDVRFQDVFELEDKKALVRAALDPYGLSHFLQHAKQLRDDFEIVTSGGHVGFNTGDSQTVSEALSNTVVASQIGRTRDLNFGYRPRYKLVTWEEMNANLFGALKLQKVVLTVFFLIIIAVAAFNVVGSQIMLIHDKRSSIAILKAMGASERGIMKVFLIQGGAVSAVGTSVGLTLGLGLCALIDFVGYPLDSEVYLISSLPVEVTPGLIVVVGLMAVVLTTVTTLYSSGRASRMDPVDGLRHLD